MKRKIVAIMLAAVVVSASVVGCGENKATETESKKETARERAEKGL